MGTFPGANRTKPVRSAALSARARQLTPQACERVRVVTTDKRLSHAVIQRVGPLLALAFAISLLGAGSASAQGGTTPQPDTTTTTPTSPSPYTQVFPLPGAHTFGDGFGAARGKRGHMGQDIMSACGEPLVSISWARVIFIGVHRAAGNYMVLRYKKLKQDYAYMHMAGKPVVRKKQKVAPGQLVGYVGNTGNASTCHLHFELWVGRWYRGGRAVNPLESLTYWDSYS
jgi:murein DD-endopeptidase MepM/ murein hydrolase activator NlpD